MIPILYAKTETVFLSNGLGRLTECSRCEVTEERNGVYELEFVYPVTGKLYSQLIQGGVVSVIHDDRKDRQSFDIYKYSAPIDGNVTFYARHISYRLSGIAVSPFTAGSCALALDAIVSHSMQTNPFSFWTDKNVVADYTVAVPSSARALLGGVAGSILDVYGKGEYEFDNWSVKLYTNRGQASGVTIRYGKNLTNFVRELDDGQTYNAVAPFWQSEDTVVKLPEGYVVQTGATDIYCVPLDLSSAFDSEPTENELRARAQAYLTNNEPWEPSENITLDFVQLWQTDEYKDYAVLQRVSLCDTVSIYFPAVGLTQANAKVIRVVYDVLNERYTQMELGEPKTSLSDALVKPAVKELQKEIDLKPSYGAIQAAIEAATRLITGADGGHVVIKQDQSGEPEEIMIMDTDDKSTAVNVWRWNLNGLGHSHTGYNGPYNDVAITMDGKINASMILTGYLVANYIKGGTLSLGGFDNEDGIWVVLDANGNEVARGDKDGVTSKALTATEYVYINGGEGSYLRIPLNGNDPTSEYIEISDDATQPFHVRLGSDTPNTFFDVLINSFGLQVAESFLGRVDKSAITYNGLKVSSDANSSGGFYSLLYMEYKDSAGTKRFRIGPTLPPYSGDYEIRINDSNGALWAKISPSYWTGEPELQLVGHNGNGDIILSPGVGLQIGSTTLNETQLQQLLALI